MSFNLITSNRTEELLDYFADAARKDRVDPFEEDFVVIPGTGLQAWITLELARRERISGNLRFLTPEGAVWMLAGATDENGRKIERNPFSKERMAWRIREALPGLLAGDQEEFAPLRKYLSGADPLKTIQLCWQIAATFDGYLNYRPYLISKWERGETESSDTEEAWQFSLWTRIYKTMPCPSLGQIIRNPAFKAATPPRTWVFGLSHLPPVHLEVFRRYAQDAELHFLHLQPSPEYWGEVLSKWEVERERKKVTEAMMTNLDDETLYLDLGPRLLGGLSKTGRTFIHALCDTNPIEIACPFAPSEATSLLGDLQNRILNLETETDLREKPPHDPGDSSIQVHSCHGPVRELEALREFLLDLFERDQTGLRPNDVLVLTPSINTYGPLVPAVFGNPETTNQRIAYGICDREWRSESRVIDTFYTLLEFAEGRANARDTFELIDRPVIKQTFQLSDEEVDEIRWWIDQCEIAWGFDGEHKEQLGLPPVEENTWIHGLDRMLLGFCMDGRTERTFGGILPFDEIEGQKGETLAKLVKIVRALEDLHDTVRRPRKPKAWKKALRRKCLEVFFVDDDETHADLLEIRKSLDFLAKETPKKAEKESLPSIRHHLELTINEKAGYSRHLTHGVTFASMRSARCVPAKIICLLGMNGREFPGRDLRPSFDLTKKNPRITDRNAGEEDRLLILEIILSAREALYLSFHGQSNKDNQAIPPSVVIPEILEELDNLRDFGSGSEGEPIKAEQALIKRHPLQAYGRRYFMEDSKDQTTEDAMGEISAHGQSMQSYSERNLEAAKALTSPRQPVPRFSLAPLEEPPEENRNILLKDLVRFWSNPCEYFVRERIGIGVWQESILLPDSEMLEADALEKYHLRAQITKLLQGLDKGTASNEAAKAKEVLRKEGRLPPGELGEALFHEIVTEAEDFLKGMKTHLALEKLPPHSFGEKIGAFEIKGEIEPIHGNTLVIGRPAKTKNKDLVRSWVMHLASNAFGPLAGQISTLVAGTDKQFVFSPIGSSRAVEILTRLLELYWTGMRRPLCFFPETGAKWFSVTQENENISEGSDKRKDPLEAAKIVWEGGDYAFGEQRNFANGLCYPDDPIEDPEFAKLSTEIFGQLFEMLEE